MTCTINSKINGTPKGLYLPISKLHSILAIVNLLAHDSLWLCYYGQVNSQKLKSSVASKWASKNLWGVPFILLLAVATFVHVYAKLCMYIYIFPGKIVIKLQKHQPGQWPALNASASVAVSHKTEKTKNFAELLRRKVQVTQKKKYW